MRESWNRLTLSDHASGTLLPVRAATRSQSGCWTKVQKSMHWTASEGPLLRYIGGQLLYCCLSFLCKGIRLDVCNSLHRKADCKVDFRAQPSMMPVICKWCILCASSILCQDGVRGEHMEVTKLLLDHGGKIYEDTKVSL
jgi:hypothetical protein